MKKGKKLRKENAMKARSRERRESAPVEKPPPPPAWKEPEEQIEEPPKESTLGDHLRENFREDSGYHA